MRVLIVDDHPLYREGLKTLISGIDPGVETIDAASVREAVEIAASVVRPDLVLLDMNLPGVGGIEGLRLIQQCYDEAIVVVVSGDEHSDLIHRAIEAGASGYIPKSTDAAVTVQALRLVLARGVYLPAEALKRGSGRAQPPVAAPELSHRQWTVLRRLLQGKSNKIIARELEIAEGTVKAHLWAIYQTLGVSSRTQALYRAHELDLFRRHAPCGEGGGGGE